MNLAFLQLFEHQLSKYCSVTMHIHRPQHNNNITNIFIDNISIPYLEHILYLGPKLDPIVSHTVKVGIKKLLHYTLQLIIPVLTIGISYRYLADIVIGIPKYRHIPVEMCTFFTYN